MSRQFGVPNMGTTSRYARISALLHGTPKIRMCISLCVSNLVRGPTDPNCQLAWNTRYVLLLMKAPRSFYLRHFGYLFPLWSWCHRHAILIPIRIMSFWSRCRRTVPLISETSPNVRRAVIFMQHSSFYRRQHFFAIQPSSSHCHSLVIIAQSWHCLYHTAYVMLPLSDRRSHAVMVTLLWSLQLAPPTLVMSTSSCHQRHTCFVMQ